MRILFSRSAPLVLLLVAMATLWLGDLWVWRNRGNHELAGTWNAPLDHPSAEVRRDGTIVLELKPNGTFVLTEIVRVGDSTNRSTHQTSGTWERRGTTLRLVLQKDYWNCVFEYMEYQILEVGETQLVLQQDGLRYELHRRTPEEIALPVNPG